MSSFVKSTSSSSLIQLKNHPPHPNMRLKNDTEKILIIKNEGVGGTATLSSVGVDPPQHTYNMKPQSPSTSTSKTIMITNNITQNGNTRTTSVDKHHSHHHHHHHSHNRHSSNSGSSGKTTAQQSSSITILTSHSDIDDEMICDDVVVDRINICINNHFNEAPPLPPQTTSAASSQQPPSTSSTALKNTNELCFPTKSTSSKTLLNGDVECLDDKKDEPDSTTAHSPNNGKELVKFANGQDVLVQHKDGRLYLGTVIAVARQQCLVKFGDNTEWWSSFDELTRLSSTDTDSSPVCVVCKTNSDKDTVEVCEKCCRGYHEKCTDGNFSTNGVWYCRRCTAQNRVKGKEGVKSVRKEARKICSTDGSRKFNSSLSLYHKNQLPYEIDALTWDSHHRVNVEQIYCYCGTNGKWYTQMLQCVRCEQWFHEKCVQCLKYPLYCGDKFYIFVCSMCNYGNEFIRRLELDWEDVIHLLLFNLTIYNRKKYYDLSTVIHPYFLDNMPFLQLPKHIRDLTSPEIVEKISDTLKSHRSRFKSGREIKKSGSIWGLRSRIPPSAIKIELPPKIAITESTLVDNLPPNIKFLSSSSCMPFDPYQNDAKIQNMMMGVALNISLNDDDESQTSTDSTIDLICNSDDEIPIKEMEYISRKLKDERDSSSKCSSNMSSSMQLMSTTTNSRTDFIHDSEENSNDSCYDLNTKEFLDVDDLSKMDFDDTKPTLKIQSTKNRSIHRSRKSTPAYSLLRHDELHKLNTIEICDSSDETSSRGTLDLIIPPPKNFQGRNNPFHNQNMMQQQDQKQKLDSKKLKSSGAGIAGNEKGIKGGNNRKGQQQGLSINQNGGDNKNTAGQLHIVRTVKRRLSTKDILIGPNQEVKRRRIRRRSGHVEVISTQTLHTVSKTAAYLPIRTDCKDWSLSTIRSKITSNNSLSSSPNNGTTNAATTTTSLPSSSISNIFNGRRLRQRQEKNYSENSRRISSANVQNGTANTSINSSPGVSFSLPGSPAKNNTSCDNISMTELQTSVNMYFGAVNRISNGEKFVIRGKRLGPDGRYQYLVEWIESGVSSS